MVSCFVMNSEKVLKTVNKVTSSLLKVLINYREMRIVKYKSEYRKYFENQNKDLLEKYSVIEKVNKDFLSHADDLILKGGQIFFASHQNKMIGTVALIRIDEGIYDVDKMIVDEGFNGIVEKKLFHTAFNEASKLNAKKLILYSDSYSVAAIDTFKNLAFEISQPHESKYGAAGSEMELLFKSVTATSWFERDFTFNFGVENFDNLFHRLSNFPVLLKHILNIVPDKLQKFVQKEKWSVNENIGHLFLLEVIWRDRFWEISNGKEQMSSADLNNNATTQSSFNKFSTDELFSCFSYEREKTLTFLRQIQQNDLSNYSIHPRLNQPMRIVDLMYFVAEHDQHHLNAILKITDEYKEKNTAIK